MYTHRKLFRLWYFFFFKKNNDINDNQQLRQIVYSSKALDELWNFNQSDLRQQQTTMTIIIINPHRLRRLAITCSSTSSIRFKNNNNNVNKTNDPHRLRRFERITINSTIYSNYRPQSHRLRRFATINNINNLTVNNQKY